jgi:hypothetical protein
MAGESTDETPVVTSPSEVSASHSLVWESGMAVGVIFDVDGDLVDS